MVKRKKYTYTYRPRASGPKEFVQSRAYELCKRGKKVKVQHTKYGGYQVLVRVKRRR